MSPETSNDRHLALTGVRRYLQAGTPGDILIPGAPDAYLIIHANGHTLSIHVRAAGTTTVPDLRAYQHLDADTIHWRQEHWLRLTVRTAHRPEDLYPLLCLVLDGIQLHGRSFTTSVNEALEAYREMLVQRGALSDTDQIGLVGELLALRHLIGTLGARAASTAWVGTAREEHDFSLNRVDVEVKTTAAASRSHWISSSTQLEAKPGRPLFLLSLQITRAGAAAGYTLPELVHAARVEAGAAEPDVSASLRDADYRDQDADLYPTRWTLRNLPITYLVDAEFPAITPTRLVDAVPHASLITGLSYRLDLDSYPASDPPQEFLGLTTSEENFV